MKYQISKYAHVIHHYQNMKILLREKKNGILYQIHD